MLRETWPGAVALLVAFVPYYLRTLHVLGDRYGVGTAKAGGRTFTGRPVWEDAIHFLAPGAHDVNYFTVLAVVGIVALLVRRRRPRRRVLRDHDRGADPLLLARAGERRLGALLRPVHDPGDAGVPRARRRRLPARSASWAGGARLLVIAILVAGLVGIELRYVDHRRERAAAGSVSTRSRTRSRHRPRGSVLFGSTGTSGAFFSSFDYGHPANLLDHYLVAARSTRSTRRRRLVRACAAVRHRAARRRVRASGSSMRPPPDEVAAARTALRVAGARVEEVPASYFVVRSRAPLAAARG